MITGLSQAATRPAAAAPRPPALARCRAAPAATTGPGESGAAAASSCCSCRRRSSASCGCWPLPPSTIDGSATAAAEGSLPIHDGSALTTAEAGLDALLRFSRSAASLATFVAAMRRVWFDYHC
jgi:hypothetical protein